ncbi:polypeptide N-acetylgalactosaminyltransferase 18 [Platysternon megacephalum]|uniref:Polypeptide N-acetylgalactosaminyltransferase 18 n=1 Tax=Platysternon megacephalum TaxID=55544 RepID=A0A4D9E9F6_9SAUR|nr:polypeptide N-acetylgalactosaminyltransferase 18 [Platysternon megacephalum]
MLYCPREQVHTPLNQFHTILVTNMMVAVLTAVVTKDYSTYNSSAFSCSLKPLESGSTAKSPITHSYLNAAKSLGLPPDPWEKQPHSSDCQKPRRVRNTLDWVVVCLDDWSF